MINKIIKIKTIKIYYVPSMKVNQNVPVNQRNSLASPFIYSNKQFLFYASNNKINHDNIWYVSWLLVLVNWVGPIARRRNCICTNLSSYVCCFLMFVVVRLMDLFLTSITKMFLYDNNFWTTVLLCFEKRTKKFCSSK